MCNSNEGPTGRGDVGAAAGANATSPRGRSTKSIAASSPVVIARPSAPATGINTSPAAVVASASGRLSTVSMPSSKPPGIAQNQAGITTIPSTPTHSPTARPAGNEPSQPQPADHAKSRDQQHRATRGAPP